MRTWEEVGSLLKRRRDKLGLSRGGAAEKAKSLGLSVSLDSITNLERGKKTSYRAQTLIGYARALDLEDDAIDRLLAGEDLAVAKQALVDELGPIRCHAVEATMVDERLAVTIITGDRNVAVVEMLARRSLLDLVADTLVDVTVVPAS